MNGNGGTSTQGTPDEAKNIFTIGSSEMQTSAGEQKMNINDLSQNSAHGPALYGRIIPHMVAPGYLVDSTLPGGAYGLKGGTSMSSPHVTGAVALFYEKYRRMFGDGPSPALVKAAFLPVAHDLAGSLDADDNFLGHPFDAKQGWGRLNTSDVLDPSGTVYYDDAPVILDDSGDQWQVSLDIEAPIAGIRAMLVWTDAPGHGLGGDTPAWVNDLDLSLSVGGDTYYGNYFDSSGVSSLGGTPDGMNNTEGIFLSNPDGGSYTFTVTASQIAGDGVPGFGDETDQDFALVIYLQGNDYYFPLIYR
jgi:subtilisin family serine protease